MRIAAILEYDGSEFSGWQRQEHARSVQGTVEEALSKVADEPIQVTVAGRTDAGVHALAQTIHFDTSAARSEYSWVRGANSSLPSDVALLWAAPVDDGFHARYSATGRHYHYVILNRPIRPVQDHQGTDFFLLRRHRLPFKTDHPHHSNRFQNIPIDFRVHVEMDKDIPGQQGDQDLLTPILPLAHDLYFGEKDLDGFARNTVMDFLLETAACVHCVPMGRLENHRYVILSC